MSHYAMKIVETKAMKIPTGMILQLR